MERVKIKFDKNGKFAKGNAGGRGRPLGKPNKVTAVLKNATMEAAAMVGFDQEGEGGLHGYLAWAAINEPVAFLRLLEKVLPLQITGSIVSQHTQRYETMDDLREELAARGLPAPRALIDITPTVQRKKEVQHVNEDAE